MGLGEEESTTPSISLRIWQLEEGRGKLRTDKHAVYELVERRGISTQFSTLLL